MPLYAIVGMGRKIGLATARRFGNEGFKIAMIARNDHGLDEMLGVLQREGHEAFAYPADAGEEESLHDAFAQIRADHGDPDVLHYNAAAMHERDVLADAPEGFVYDFRVNLLGAVVACQECVPAMRKRGNGSVLFTGGGFALEPAYPFASLGIGKAAIRNLCFSLNQELAKDGVHVATVTICGIVGHGGRFDPDTIAGEFWRLHAQPSGEWERELLFR